MLWIMTASEKGMLMIICSSSADWHTSLSSPWNKLTMGFCARNVQAVARARFDLVRQITNTHEGHALFHIHSGHGVRARWIGPAGSASVGAAAASGPGPARRLRPLSGTLDPLLVDSVCPRGVCAAFADSNNCWASVLRYASAAKVRPGQCA